MAEQARSYGSVKRFGVRYGTKLKGKIDKIEAERRQSTKCPHCHYDHVKRLYAGVWHCTKCKSKFTGKAYTVGKPAGIKAEAEETAQAAEQAPQAEEDFGEEEAELENDAAQGSGQEEEA